MLARVGISPLTLSGARIAPYSQEEGLRSSVDSTSWVVGGVRLTIMSRAFSLTIVSQNLSKNLI